MKKWQGRISSGLVGEYRATREFQHRGQRGESSNVQVVESQVERRQPRALCIDELNPAWFWMNHAHFASAVNRFSNPAEQISSKRVPHGCSCQWGFPTLYIDRFKKFGLGVEYRRSFSYKWAFSSVPVRLYSRSRRVVEFRVSAMSMQLLVGVSDLIH